MLDGTHGSLNQPKTEGSSRLTTLFLVIFLLVSLAFMAVRNTYDDEYTNLNYVQMSVAQVIHTANSADVHPPGMYLLSHFAYRAIPSTRWMVLFDFALLYAGLATFLFAITPLLPNTAARLCFLLLASLQPQLIMWGITIRWYGWWTAIAMITLVVALRPRVSGSRLNASEPTGLELSGRPAFSYGRATILGLLLTSLFYLNYITLVFGVALGAAMLYRYGLRVWKQYLLTLAVFVLLIAPQLHAFVTVHIPGGGGQRTGLAISLVRLSVALLCSEAYLPWHPLAILAALVFLAILIAGGVQAFRVARTKGLSAAVPTQSRGLRSLLLFLLVFFFLVVAGGFGLKPRNGLLLVPVLAVLYAVILGSFRSARLQGLLLLFLAVWVGVGIEHLLLRQGMSKSNMNNHPEELSAYIRQTGGQACAVVLTYDSLMAYTLSASALPRTLLLDPEASPIPVPGKPLSLSDCSQVDLYRVKSYTGGLGPWGDRMRDEMSTVFSSPSTKTLNLSFDPEAMRKRKLTFMSGASDLPDYRYQVLLDHLSPAQFFALEPKMPDFKPRDGRSIAAVNGAVPGSGQ